MSSGEKNEETKPINRNLSLSNRSLKSNELADDKLQTRRKIKSFTIYPKDEPDGLYAAPLAKQESISDIINELDETNHVTDTPKEMNNLEKEKNLSNNHGNVYYEENLSFKNSTLQLKTSDYHHNQNETRNQQLDDDELRTNLAWWPYTESHLNNENNSQLYSLAKAKDNDKKIVNKIKINIDKYDDDDDQEEEDGKKIKQEIFFSLSILLSFLYRFLSRSVPLPFPFQLQF